MSTPARLLVGVPTANGFIMSDTVHALMGTAAQLSRQGIEVSFRCVDGPDIALQRDLLADDFLRSDCTHLLLIGSHVAFSFDLAARLLAARKPLVGAIHPRRPLDLSRLGALAERHTFDAALALSFDWGVRLEGREVEVREGLCRVAAFSSDVVLVERGCLETIAARLAAPSYASPQGGRLLAFFRFLPDEDAPPGSRDEAICHRWRAAGGQVWADVASEVRVVGEFRFGLPFVDYLQALRALERGPPTAGPRPG